MNGGPLFAIAVLTAPILIDPTVWAALGIGVGGFLFYRGFALLRRRRLILNTPRSTVRGAAIGLVEVSGKAVGPYSLISPLSALSCYYYRAVAWQNQGHQWRKAAEETLYTPLFIDDGTGQLLIDPRHAEMDLPTPFSHEYGDSAFAAELLPDYISHFLHRHGVSSDCGLKLEEQCILPGDVLFVLGTLQENPRVVASEASSGVARRFIPSFVSREAADLQCRGMLEHLDPAAGKSLANAAVASDSANFDLQPEVLLAKGPARDPFFISWCSQREVVLTAAWRAFLYLWVGPILILFCLWLLVSPAR